MTKVKKIDSSLLKIDGVEYDPFLVEKVTETLNKIYSSSSSNSNGDVMVNKNLIKWIAETFNRCYEDS